MSQQILVGMVVQVLVIRTLLQINKYYISIIIKYQGI
jgi:hypothetical protein